MSERNKKENRPSYRVKTPKKLKLPALERKFYDNADMMQLFNVSERTLQRWRDDDVIPWTKIGGKIIYVAKEIHELMKRKSKGK